MQALQIETTLEPELHHGDADLDRITDFAQKSLRVDEAAVISTGNADQQFQRSAVEQRLAALVIEGNTVIAVPDVIFHQDATTGAVCGFLGVPIHDSNGNPVSALCVMTHETRIWSRRDREMLQFLGGELEEITRMRETVEVETRRAAQHRLVAREYQSLVEKTSGQLAALADAHSSIGFDDEAADLSKLVNGALQPYTFSEASVEANGSAIEIAEENVISVSLILNELATNSTKYGAFRFGGSLRVNWAIEDGQLTLRWSERSVQPRTTCTNRIGSFGGTMMDLSVTQLKAKLDRIWLRDGLEVKLTFPV